MDAAKGVAREQALHGPASPRGCGPLAPRGPRRAARQRCAHDRASGVHAWGRPPPSVERRRPTIPAAAGLAAAAVIAASTSTLAAQIPDRRSGLHQFRLANGFEIIVVENHAVPIATVLVAVRGGANAQARGEEGLAHMLEHLLFRSFGDGAASFGSAAAKLDADFQGTTDLEVVSYYLQLPSANAEAGVRLLGRLVSQAKFAGDDIRAERNVVLDELMRDKADPLAGLRRSVARRLWGDSWHRRDVGGDSLSLMGLTARQLSDAQARLYLPGNSALIVTGDVQPEAMRMAAEQAFGRWMPGGRAAARSPPDPIRPVAAPEVLLIPYGVPDVTVRVAMPGPRLGADTSAAYTASTLFAILDEPSSAFQQQLVGSGLFQRLAASYDGGSDAGEIVFEGWTTAERAIDALRGLMVMVDGLDRHLDIRAQDLAIAARRSEVDAALTFEATAALAPILASWWAQTGLDYYLEYSRRGEAPTADDLRRFAERHVAAQPKVYGVLGPAAAVAAIRDWLATGRPER